MSISERFYSINLRTHNVLITTKQYFYDDVMLIYRRTTFCMCHFQIALPLKYFRCISIKISLNFGHHLMQWWTSSVTHIYVRAISRLAPSQWETSLQSVAVSHWLGTNLESTLYASPCLNIHWCILSLLSTGTASINEAHFIDAYRLHQVLMGSVIC